MVLFPCRTCRWLLTPSHLLPDIAGCRDRGNQSTIARMHVLAGQWEVEPLALITIIPSSSRSLKPCLPGQLQLQSLSTSRSVAEEKAGLALARCHAQFASCIECRGLLLPGVPWRSELASGLSPRRVLSSRAPLRELLRVRPATYRNTIPYHTGIPYRRFPQAPHCKTPK